MVRSIHELGSEARDSVKQTKKCTPLDQQGQEKRRTIDRATFTRWNLWDHQEGQMSAEICTGYLNRLRRSASIACMQLAWI